MKINDIDYHLYFICNIFVLTYYHHKWIRFSYNDQDSYNWDSCKLPIVLFNNKIEIEVWCK